MIYTETSHAWPLLALLQFVPWLAAVLLIRLRGNRAFIVASVASVLELALALALYMGFDHTQPFGVMQYAEQFTLWRALQYHAAVDGVSVLFVLLTAVLSLLSIIFMVFRNQHGSAMLGVMMAIQATLMNQFVTMDLLFFIVASALQILFVGYLTKRWGTTEDITPTLVRFLQFMGVGLLLMLLGMLLLGWNYAASEKVWSFDLYKLASVPVQETVAPVIFFALFYGLAVRIPLFPFHGWLPDFIKFGNIAMAPIAVLGMKVGIYGLWRFALPLTPKAAWDWHLVAVAFAVTGVFYAALLALRQQNLRSLLAYAVVSHTGIITIGLFSLNAVALKGSLLMSLNTGLAISSLLFMTGLIWQRTRTTNLHRLGMMFDYIPMVGIAFFIAGLAIVGMPGTPGFDAVHFVLEGAITSIGAPITILASLGNLIAAGFLLRSFQRVFLSEPEGDTAHWNKKPAELTEMILAGMVIFITLAVGFYDAPWLALIEKPIEGVTSLFSAFQPITKEGH